MNELRIGNKVYSQLSKAEYLVTIEVDSGDGSAFANPIERFKDLRVCHSIDLSTVDDENHGNDGALEPFVSLFEPLIPGTDFYYLPWNIPKDLKLVDDGKWGGWDSWLGNDNARIDECKIEFTNILDSVIAVRWIGVVPEKKCEFSFIGEVNIGPVVMYGPATLKVQETIERLFGEDQSASVIVDQKAIPYSLIPGWTKFEVKRA